MKSYKCINCKGKFETPGEVDECPYCGSDNITPYTNLPPYLLMVLLFILCIPIGFGAGRLVDMGFKSDGGTSNVTDAPVSVTDPTAIPVIVSVTEPILSKQGYSVEVIADVKTGAELEFSLTPVGGEGQVYFSEDGKFAGVAPTEDGVYNLVVRNVQTQDCVDRVLSGFSKPVQQPIVKLSKTKLQEILDTQSAPKGLYLKFAEGYRMKFIDLDGAEPEPDRFDEILNRLSGAIWSSAEILDIQYDELNRITSITIKVIY